MTNKEIAMKAMQELFVKRNENALNKYWVDPYIQHNPSMENGLDGIRKTLPYLPAQFIYEPGIVIAEGDFVAAHSRVVGWGASPMIIVDIFRIKDGRIVEHWDVIQEEVEKEKSKNGNPMTSFHIAKYNMRSITLEGNKFFADLSPLSIELSFGTDNTVTFIVTKGGGLVADGHTETLSVSSVEIHKNIFFLGWTELSGATVTHVEDYNTEVVYTHITMPDGKFFHIKGKLTPLSTPSVRIDVPQPDDKLDGKVVVQAFDDHTVELYFKGNGEVEVKNVAGKKEGHREVVTATVTCIYPECFLVSWQDQDLNSVVQVIDIGTGSTYSNITRPGNKLGHKKASVKFYSR